MSANSLQKTTADLKAYIRQAQKAGRKRKAPVTLPKLHEVDVKERPRLAKVRVEMQADSLGIRRGEYQRRPKMTVDMASGERCAHARKNGVRLLTEKETFEDGRPTGLQHKRFRGFLEVWHSKRVIDDVTFAAAQEFQRDCDLSLEASPRMISRYGHIMPGGAAELLPQEIQIEFEKRKRAAINEVDRQLHFILAWIAEVSNTEVHPDEVAERYWPTLAQKTRMERFKALLEFTCMTLSVHYGLQTRHRWVKLSLSRAAEEIADLLRA